MNIKVLIFINIILIKVEISAQPQFNNYRTTNTGSNGLVCNWVNSIAQKSDGTIWLGTYWGVCSYNNSSWTDHTLEFGLDKFLITNSVTNYPELLTRTILLCIDTLDNVWIGPTSYNYLIKYDGQSYQAIAMPSGCNASNYLFCDSQNNIWIVPNNNGVYFYDGNQCIQYSVSEGFPNNMALSVFEDSFGNVWIGGYYFLCKFNGSGFDFYTCSHPIYDMIEDDQGHIWCACGNAVLKFDGSNFSSELSGAGFGIENIEIDNQGNILCGSVNLGIFIYNGSVWNNYISQIGTNVVLRSFKDNQGILWFGSNRGLIIYNNSVFSFISTEDGLSDNYISGIYCDYQNNIWFNTSRFVSKLSVTDWSTDLIVGYWSEEDGYSNHIFNSKIMSESNGNIWIIKDSFGKYDPSGFTFISSVNFNGGGIALSMSECAPDTLFFGTYQGLIKAEGTDYGNPSTFTICNQGTGLPSDCIFSQLKDHADILWLGTALGISYYDGTGFYYFSHDENLGDSIYDIVEDSDYNLWFASNHGVGEYDGNIWTYYHEQDGLSDNEVHELLYDSKGRMWFATGNGLSMLDTTGWTVYHESDGLVYDRTLCLEEDNDGNIWVGTYYGVSKLVFPEDTLNIKQPLINSDHFIFDILNNPTSGKFTIRTNRQPDVTIYNSTGTKIQARQIRTSNSKEFDLSGLSSGIYFVKGLYKENTIKKKIIKI